MLEIEMIIGAIVSETISFLKDLDERLSPTNNFWLVGEPIDDDIFSISEDMGIDEDNEKIYITLRLKSKTPLVNTLTTKSLDTKTYLEINYDYQVSYNVLLEQAKKMREDLTDAIKNSILQVVYKNYIPKNISLEEEELEDNILGNALDIADSICRDLVGKIAEEKLKERKKEFSFKNIDSKSAYETIKELLTNNFPSNLFSTVSTQMFISDEDEGDFEEDFEE